MTRKEELLAAATGAETNIEIAKLFRQGAKEGGDEAGVSQINDDINCLQRWAGLDRQLAESEEN